MTDERIVVALGGNALLPRGQAPDAAAQVEQVARVAPTLAELAVRHEMVLVHGNGPQVGMLALESAADRSLSRAYPLSDLVAETQGLIGYWLQQALGNAGCEDVVTLVTQTLVDASDPAFGEPSKFVGSLYAASEAHELAAAHGWMIRPDGDGWRRVVPSPDPQAVLEIGLAERLLRAGSTVVLAGGGGVPVIRTATGLRGVDAVVDKDLSAALVGEQLHADLLVMLTDVPAVMADFGTPAQRPLGEVTVDELDEGIWAAGSMGPKVNAACQFVRATGGRAAIGSLDEAAQVVAGRAGTQVRSPGPDRPASTGRTREGA